MPEVAWRHNWRPGYNIGIFHTAKKRPWFVVIDEPGYHRVYTNRGGSIKRFASYEAAKKFADKLNKEQDLESDQGNQEERDI